MKGFGRKIISLILAVTMTVSLVNVSAFAATGEDSLDPGTWNVVHDGTEVTSAQKDGSGNPLVKIQKTAKATNDPDTFDITLKAQTKDGSGTVVTPGTSAHIALVIDCSASMADERIAKAKEAAKAFTETVLGANASQGNKVAVVTYGKTAKVPANLSKDKSVVESAIDKVSANSTYSDEGGTNTQAGLAKAQEILNAGNVNGVKNVVLLLSDGYPTYSYKATAGEKSSVIPGWSYWDGDERAFNPNGHYNLLLTSFSNTVKGDGGTWSYSAGNRGDTYNLKGLKGNDYKIQDNILPTLSQAKLVKDAKTDIYSVLLMNKNDPDYTIANHVMKNAATDAAHYSNAQAVGDLSKIFTDIASTVTKPTSAGLITDPMGKNIEYVKAVSEVPDGTASCQNGILTVDTSKLTPATENGYSVYTFTYQVRLNVYADGFEENQAYAANGATTFAYNYNNAEQSLAFNVPTVEATLPEVRYTINYYKQNSGRDAYALADTTTGKARLHATVGAPEGYQTKYAGEYYFFHEGDTSMTLKASDNTLNLYYDHQTAKVTVNQSLTTTTRKKDGSTAVATEKLPESIVDQPVNKGSSFTAEDLSQRAANKDTWTLDTNKSDKNLTIDPVVNDSYTINLYYNKTIDEREAASVQVIRKFTTETWSINPVTGRYEKTEATQTDSPETVVSSARAYESYPLPTDDVKGYKYESGSAQDAGGGNIDVTDGKIVLKPGVNTVTLNYRKAAGDKPAAAPASLTVYYTFTKTEQVIENNTVKTVTTYPMAREIPESGYYVGETYRATAPDTLTVNGEIYTRDGGADQSVTLVKTANVVTFHYTLTKTIEQTSVTVNYIYHDHEKVVGQDGKAADQTTTSEPVVKTIDGQYVGTTYTAEDETTYNGKTYTPTANNKYSAAVLAAGKTVITLYYDSAVEDKRPETTLVVTHHYVTTTETLVENKPGEIVTTADQTESAVTGKVGDEVPISSKPSYKDSTYTPDAGNIASYTLKAGANTVTQNYNRTVNDLKETSYKVTYRYLDQKMTVNASGVAGYYESPSLTSEESKNSEGTWYVGQQISLDEGKKDGYSLTSAKDASGHDIGWGPTLVSGTNEYTIVYTRRIPLAQDEVKVTDVYTTTTKSENGTQTTDTQTVERVAVTKYVGESLKVESAPANFTFSNVTCSAAGYTKDSANAVTLTVPKDGAQVTYNYTKLVDNSVPATFTVKHFYRTLDWNNAPLGADNKPVSGDGYAEAANQTVMFASYATVKQAGTADTKNDAYTLDSVKANGNALTQAPYELSLVKGANTMYFYYTKHVDTREATSVTVNHTYRVKDANAAGGYVTEGTYTEVITDKNSGAYVGSKFTAVSRPTFGVRAYTLNGSVPTITLEKDTAKNVVNLTYTRDYGEAETFAATGKVTYSGIAQSLYPTKNTTVSLADESNKVLQTVSVAADGSFGFTAKPGKYHVVENGTLVSGYTNTVAYSIVGAQSKEALSSFTLNGDFMTSEKTLLIENVYTVRSNPSGGGTVTPVTPTPVGPASPENPGTTIPDDQTPLAGDPTASTAPTKPTSSTQPTASTAPTKTAQETTEIDDENTPKADAPKTGDDMFLWLLAAIASGAGLAWMTLIGRKKKASEKTGK